MNNSGEGLENYLRWVGHKEAGVTGKAADGMSYLITGVMACLSNIFQSWVIVTKIAGYHNLIKELSAISLIDGYYHILLLNHEHLT